MAHTRESTTFGVEAGATAGQYTSGVLNVSGSALDKKQPTNGNGRRKSAVGHGTSAAQAVEVVQAGLEMCQSWHMGVRVWNDHEGARVVIAVSGMAFCKTGHHLCPVESMASAEAEECHACSGISE